MGSKNTIDTANLSQEEIKSLAVSLLGKIEKSKNGLGKDLFNAIARLTVMLCFEVVCLRKNSATNQTEVYLIKRAPDETSYPGQWHIPGSVMRPGEEIEDVLLRLSQKEIGLEIMSKKFIFHVNYPKEPRGHFFSLIYLCQLSKEPGKGKWFAVNQLPENIIEPHRTLVIPKAITFFN